MNKKKTLIAASAVAAAAGASLVALAIAKRRKRRKTMGGWGIGTKYDKLFNPKKLATYSGKVVSIDYIKPIKGMTPGVHALLETEDGESVAVHLGPAWYIENQDVIIAPKDQIEVTGCKVKLNGDNAVIATEVKRGEEVLVLRDDKGKPVWSGWRKSAS
jgi:hypothetical protein